MNPIITTDTLTMSRDASETFDGHVPAYVAGRRRKDESVAPGFKTGLEWTTIVIQSHLMMPLLRRLCSHRGIRLRKQEVTTAESFASSQVKKTPCFAFV